MEAGLFPFVMPQNTPSQMHPLSLAVTEFHYLLLYPHALVAQSRISGIDTTLLGSDLSIVASALFLECLDRYM